MTTQQKLNRAELLREVQKLYAQVEPSLQGLMNEMLCLVLNVPTSGEFRQEDAPPLLVGTADDIIKLTEQETRAMHAVEDISKICQKYFGGK